MFSLGLPMINCTDVHIVRFNSSMAKHDFSTRRGCDNKVHATTKRKRNILTSTYPDTTHMFEISVRHTNNNRY